MEAKNREAELNQLKQERVTTNLRYIAGQIEKKEDDELDEMIGAFDQGKLPPMPSDLHEEMKKLAQELDEKNRRDKKKTLRKQRIRTLERCAVIALAVCVIGIAVTTPADAWRYRFSNLFASEEGDHVVIKPFDSEMLDGWRDYYMFSQVPEGYELTFAEDDGIERVILFTKGENQLILSVYDASMAVYADNEYASFEKVTINGNEAYLFDSAENEYSQLICLQGEVTVHIKAVGSERITKTELVELAEGLQYISK